MCGNCNYITWGQMVTHFGPNEQLIMFQLLVARTTTELQATFPTFMKVTFHPSELTRNKIMNITFRRILLPPSSGQSGVLRSKLRTQPTTATRRKTFKTPEICHVQWHTVTCVSNVNYVFKSQTAQVFLDRLSLKKKATYHPAGVEFSSKPLLKPENSQANN